ncbi:hypothetical protein [Flaviaesturariibacter aridisoli]|uniref:Uncharacterized protein n=1 Tax=Flaviaesturariibacter aridisoli TaxID=2545761 RepID=A0A4R4DZ48_9BACT|nr:hypothetical protein [Flaviaesturariibacter aridisoli]TCZ69607.1 hypothetical protein E0486_12320 [Flaviaesturariibacter aridisoli]
MKKHIQSSKFARTTLFLAALLSATLSLPAQVIAQGPEDGGTPDVSIIPVTSPDGRPTFQVRIDKRDQEAMELSIADTEGEVLFSETIRGAHYDRFFLIDIPSPNVKLVLRLGARKGTRKQTYEIDTQLQQSTHVAVASR